MSRGVGLDGQAADDSQERYFRWLFTRLGVPARGRCLDIGCSDPRVLGAFAATDRVPVGFSFDGLNSLNARRLYPDAELAELDYDEAGAVYARAGDAFDFMFCRGLGFAERLLDWRDESFVAATRALSQCLTPNGVLLWAHYPDRRMGVAEPIVRRRAVQGLLEHLDLAGLRLVSFAPSSAVITILAVRPDFPIEREAVLHQANARDWLSILRHVRATLKQGSTEDDEAAAVDDATVIDALQAASAHLSTLFLPRVTEQRLLIAGTDAVARIYARAAESLGQRVVGFWSNTAGEWTATGPHFPIGWLPPSPEDRPTAIVVADAMLEPAVTIATASMTPILPVLNLWSLAPYVSDFLQSGWHGRPGLVDTQAETRVIEGSRQGFVAELLAARTAALADQLQPSRLDVHPKSLVGDSETDPLSLVVSMREDAGQPPLDPAVIEESTIRDPVVLGDPGNAEPVALEELERAETTALGEPVSSEPAALNEPMLSEPVALNEPMLSEPVVPSEPMLFESVARSASIDVPGEVVLSERVGDDVSPLIESSEILSPVESDVNTSISQSEPDNESLPANDTSHLTPVEMAIAVSPVEPDEGDIASLLRRTIGTGSIVGDGTVHRRGDALQMVAFSRRSVHIAYGPVDVLAAGQIGFAAAILRLSGTETECRVEITAGARRAVMVLGPSSVWITDSADLVVAAGVPEPTGHRARLKALLWTIATGSAPTNRAKSAIPRVAVKASEWHEYGVQMHAGGVDLWLDGAIVQQLASPVDAEGLLSAIPATVEFGLWDATDADSEVWWKDCRITEDIAPVLTIIEGE